MSETKGGGTANGGSPAVHHTHFGKYFFRATSIKLSRPKNYIQQLGLVALFPYNLYYIRRVDE